MKKKIAMCISGYLRTFKECYPSIEKNILDGNDIDIFIHTYDKIGNSSGWRSPIDLSENIDMEDRINMANKVGEEIRKLIKTYTNIDCHELYK